VSFRAWNLPGMAPEFSARDLLLRVVSTCRASARAALGDFSSAPQTFTDAADRWIVFSDVRRVQKNTLGDFIKWLISRNLVIVMMTALMG
jgi:hypothetical protein